MKLLFFNYVPDMILDFDNNPEFFIKDHACCYNNIYWKTREAGLRSRVEVQILGKLHFFMRQVNKTRNFFVKIGLTLLKVH